MDVIKIGNGKEKIKIRVIDPVCSQISNSKIVEKILSFKSCGYYGKQEKKRFVSTEVLVDRAGEFLTGFLPRVRECLSQTYRIEIEQPEPVSYQYKIPEGIKPFKDQEKLLRLGLHFQRGVIKAPTGTGKTILSWLLIYPFMPCKALIIVPTKEILHQTYKEFRDKFKVKASMVGDGKKDLSGDVVVALINTLANIPPGEYCMAFKVVVVDEVHKVSSFSGMFSDVLFRLAAPVRFGLTATTAEPGSEKAMAAEGYIGPVIGEFKMQEAVEKARLAKPKLELIPVLKHSSLSDPTVRRYADIYELAIVWNSYRNSLIVRRVKSLQEEGLSAIVFVKQLVHSRVLEEMMVAKGVRAVVVEGATQVKQRELFKKNIELKNISCIIATAAWKEGVNIPNLNCVINAAGYKDATPVTQMAGRVLRVAEGKTEGIIVDFLDVGKYISEHSIERLHTYHSLGWF